MTVVDKKALRHATYRKPIPRSYLVVFFSLVLFFVTFSYALFGFYLEHWYAGPARIAARVLPLPAALIEGEVLWYEDISEFANVFEVSGKDVGTDITDPFQSGLERASRNIHLEHFATKLGIEVTKAELENYEIVDESFELFLESVGWNEKRYRSYVVRSLLLAQKLEAEVLSNAEYQTKVYAEMENVLQDIELGLSFDDVAIQSSEDVSAEIGGYSGFFTKEDLPEGLQSAFSLDLYEVSDILETEEAFYVVRPYEIVGFGEDRLQIALQIIVRNKQLLAPALDAFIETQSEWYFIR